MKLFQTRFCKLIGIHRLFFDILGIFYNELIEATNFITEGDLLEINVFMLYLNDLFIRCEAQSNICKPLDNLFFLILWVSERIHR